MTAAERARPRAQQLPKDGRVQFSWSPSTTRVAVPGTGTLRPPSLIGYMLGQEQVLLVYQIAQCSELDGNAHAREAWHHDAPFAIAAEG